MDKIRRIERLYKKSRQLGIKITIPFEHIIFHDERKTNEEGLINYILKEVYPNRKILFFPAGNRREVGIIGILDKF